MKAVQITNDELYTILLYTEHYFPKVEVGVKASQWHYEKEKRNPNATGIIGEWGVLKNQGHTKLHEFLSNRPRRRSDPGDVNGDFGVFDIKTNVWNLPPESMLGKSYYCGNVEAKHKDKDFLDGFIFTTFVRPERTLYIMGYLAKEEFFEVAKFHKKGESKVNGFTFPIDAYDIHYARLKPIGELGILKAITK